MAAAVSRAVARAVLFIIVILLRGALGLLLASLRAAVKETGRPARACLLLEIPEEHEGSAAHHGGGNGAPGRIRLGAQRGPPILAEQERVTIGRLCHHRSELIGAPQLADRAAE